MSLITKRIRKSLFLVATVMLSTAAWGLMAVIPASAAIAPEPNAPSDSTTTTSTQNTNTSGTASTPSNGATHPCGSGPDRTYTSIDIGCKGLGNPITDAFFAIVRFLSNGVGLVVIGSIIYGGIQYTASRGDPQATAKALERIRASVVALIIFIFGYAILNYLIPAGFLK